LPPWLNPYIGDCVCLGHEAFRLQNTVSLYDAVGPSFHLQRQSTVFDDHFNPLGNFTVTMDFQLTSSNQAVASVNIQGTYSGTSDTVQSDGTIRANGYTMALVQTGLTNITGRFIQSVYRSGGGVLLNFVTNTYTYPSGGGPGLPFDEVAHVQVGTATLNPASARLTVLATGYYEPAPAVSGALFNLAESINGQLNGVNFSAHGSMTYDRSVVPSPMTNVMSYVLPDPFPDPSPQPWPTNWTPPIGWNDVTYDCHGLGSLILNDPVRGLADAMGPVFHLQRNSLVLDPSSNVLSSVTMHVDHLGVASQWGVADTSMQGIYNVPTNMLSPGAPVSESGFTMLLQQSGPNTISGSYVKNLSLTNGTVLANVVQDTWTYPPGGGPGLAFDESGNVQVNTRNWDGSKAFFTGTGYYSQVAAPPVLRIAPASPGYLTISWSPDSPDYKLQETPSMSPPNWIDSIYGTSNPAMVPVINSTEFYRLIKRR